MNPFRRFPAEILAIVAEHCDDIPTLRTLTCTARVFLTPARRGLYRYVRLVVEKDSLADVLTLLEERDYLTSVVERLSLQGRSRGGKYPLLDISCINKLLEATKNKLTRLEFSDFRWKESYYEISLQQPNLELLLEDIHPCTRVTDFGSLFFHLNILHKVELRGLYAFAESDALFAEPGVGRVPVVDVEFDIFGRDPVLWGVSFANVIFLKCSNIRPIVHADWIGDVIHRSEESLHELSLNIFTPGIDVDDWDQLGLDSCTSFERLTVTFSIDPAQPVDRHAKALWAILSLLPQSTVEVVINFQLQSEAPLLNYSLHVGQFVWEAYSDLLVTKQNLKKLTIRLEYDDVYIRWNPRQETVVRRGLTRLIDKGVRVLCTTS